MEPAIGNCSKHPGNNFLNCPLCAMEKQRSSKPFSLTVLFVYAKDGKVKLYHLEEAQKIDKIMISEGWKHTATIDPITWIEYLHNFSDDKLFEIKLLHETLPF